MGSLQKYMTQQAPVRNASGKLLGWVTLPFTIPTSGVVSLSLARQFDATLSETYDVALPQPTSVSFRWERFRHAESGDLQTALVPINPDAPVYDVAYFRPAPEANTFPQHEHR